MLDRLYGTHRHSPPQSEVCSGGCPDAGFESCRRKSRNLQIHAELARLMLGLSTHHRHNRAMSDSRSPRIRPILMVVTLMLTASWLATAASLPPFILPTLDGGSLSSADIQGPLIMAFVLPHSPACETVLGWVKEAAQEHPEIGFVLVTKADSAPLRKMLEPLSMEMPVLLDGSDLLASVLTAFRAPTAYSFYDGRLLARLDWPFDEGAFSSLVEELAAGPAASWPVGVESLVEQPAPGFEAVTTDGATVSLASLSKPLLLVFIAAGCPYCQAMLPDLLSIAAAFPVCLVVVGEDGEVPGLDAPLPTMLKVVRDEGYAIAGAYQMASTPTIVVVDAAGYVVWVHEGYLEGLAEVARAVAQGEGRP